MLLSLVWAALRIAGPQARAEESSPSEYKVKAECLYKLTLFMEWPAEAFPNGSAPFVVGVLGDDPFGPELEKAMENRTVKDRKIVIKRSEKAEDLKSCQILFISSSEKKRLPKIMEALKGFKGLSVSEADEFIRSGGIIRVTLNEEQKLRLEINAKAAEVAGLKISSKLLKLATPTPGERP